jgi:signal transduction histidine kinase
LANVESDFELVIQDKNASIEHDDLPVVEGNPIQLNQLFSNLIGNALKFSLAPPHIKISSRFVRDEQIVRPPEYLASGEYLELIFSDNGIGFDQKYANQIFAMFQRLHGRHQFSGTGIGLASVKRIVENHMGHVTAVSEEGKGSAFYVYLYVR